MLRCFPRLKSRHKDTQHIIPNSDDRHAPPVPPISVPRTPEGALSLYADSDPTLDKPPLVLPPLEVDDSNPRATLQCLIMRTGVYAQMHPNDVEDHLYDDVIAFCDVVRSHPRAPDVTVQVLESSLESQDSSEVFASLYYMDVCLKTFNNVKGKSATDGPLANIVSILASEPWVQKIETLSGKLVAQDPLVATQLKRCLPVWCKMVQSSPRVSSRTRARVNTVYNQAKRGLASVPETTANGVVLAASSAYALPSSQAHVWSGSAGDDNSLDSQYARAQRRQAAIHESMRRQSQMLAQAHEEDLRVATAMSLVEPTPAARRGPGGAVDDAAEEARLQEVLELSRLEAEEDARARHQRKREEELRQATQTSQPIQSLDDVSRGKVAAYLASLMPGENNSVSGGAGDSSGGLVLQRHDEDSFHDARSEAAYTTRSRTSEAAYAQKLTGLSIGRDFPTGDDSQHDKFEDARSQAAFSVQSGRSRLYTKSVVALPDSPDDEFHDARSQAAYSMRSSFTKASYAQNLQSMPVGQNSEDDDDNFLDAESQVAYSVRSNRSTKSHKQVLSQIPNPSVNGGAASNVSAYAACEIQSQEVFKSESENDFQSMLSLNTQRTTASDTFLQTGITSTDSATAQVSTRGQEQNICQTMSRVHDTTPADTDSISPAGSNDSFKSGVSGLSAGTMHSSKSVRSFISARSKMDSMSSVTEFHRTIANRA